MSQSDPKLKSYIERIQNLEEEKKAKSDEINLVYSEAKSDGYDPTIMRAVINDLKKPADALKEFETIYELYLNAIK